MQQSTTDRRAWLDGVEVGALGPADADQAVDVLARGMRDNPLHVAAYGEDPERRMRKFRRLTSAAFAVVEGLATHTLVARSANGTIVGVSGMVPPGECRPTPTQQLRILPSLLRNGPRAAGRTMRWFGVWSEHDPAERHWRLGPVAVDAHLQGMGVGSRLMRVFCAQMDAAHEEAYLETDKPENVHFYERFGFKVIAEQEVLGVPNWFMHREGRGRAGRTR